jgi:hypothetical protein
MIALEERDRNRESIRDTQLRFYYINLRVCVSHLLHPHWDSNKNLNQAFAYQEKHRFSHNGIAFTIDMIILVEPMNLFFYFLQKDSKEKLLLAFNIIGNDVGRRCTCSQLARW